MGPRSIAIATCLAILLTTSAALAERPKLAIMPLAALNIDKSIVTIMEQILVGEVSKLPDFTVISAAEINAMIGMERMKDAMGCTDAACAAEIGGALDAALMITGSVGKLGSNLTINLVLFDVRHTTVNQRVLEQVRNDENLYSGAIASAAEKLLPELAQLRKAKTAGRPSATDSNKLAVAMVQAQQQLDTDTRMASEQAKLFAQLETAIANPSLDTPRKLQLIDAFMDQVHEGSELHENVRSLREKVVYGPEGMGTIWAQLSFRFQPGAQLEIARWRWPHFQFSAATAYFSWFMPGGFYDTTALSMGGGIAGLGLKTHTTLADTDVELGFMAWPLALQSYDVDTPNWKERSTNISGLAFSMLRPYVALNFGGTHVEMGAQIPLLWHKEVFFGGIPPLSLFIGGGI